jgi:1-acyl-sn-glycerol-3-phosphate acyltransferase
LSIKSDVPVLPICHNSGIFWENKKFVKKPGMVIIKIGEPITGNSAKDITDRAYTWIKDTYEDLED